MEHRSLLGAADDRGAPTPTFNNSIIGCGRLFRGLQGLRAIELDPIYVRLIDSENTWIAACPDAWYDARAFVWEVGSGKFRAPNKTCFIAPTTL